MTLTLKQSKLWPGLAAATLMASLWAMRLSLSATESAVFFAGRELGWACVFRRAFGIACPGCGMTHSVVLMLDGDLAHAFAANPAGPLLVFGVLILCAALLISALRPSSERAHAVRTPRRIKLGAGLYGGLLAVVMMINWLRVVA